MIKLENIIKVYNPKKRNKYTALKGISLEIQDSEFTAIVGRSGSGKSTLLHIIGMLDDFTSGEYFWNDNNIGALSESAKTKLRAKNIGFVKQDFALIDEYSVLDNVMLPLYPIKAQNKRERSLETIEAVGIGKLAKKPAAELSGGEKQRTAIARAIVTQPKILLADEPTGSLDSKTSEEIFNIFRKLASGGITVIIVTHDPRLAEKCDRVITVDDGVISG